MYKQIVEYIQNVASKHKAVHTTKYQKRSYVNQQNNDRYIQVIVEENPYFQSIITQNIFTATFNIDIIGQPKDDTETLEVQNLCFQVATEILAYIDQDQTFFGQLSIHDYDYLFISKWTDDVSCGVRMSLELVIPSPLNICTYMDNFDEEIEVVETPSLDLTQAEKAVLADNNKELHLAPIKLKTKQQ